MRAAVVLALALTAAPAGASAQQPAPANPHVRLHGKACTDCHTTSGWREIRFDHRQTSFQLLGQHQTVLCAACHNLRDFAGATSTCSSCHTDPHRGDAGPRCEQCHTEVGWRQVGAQNAHARTRLPDLGVHASLRCEDCHRQTGAQQFTGSVAPCVRCHQHDYDTTTAPAHATMGLPTQCEMCHQFTTWSFARFPQHDAFSTFPIYSGAHAGVWRNCTTCHTDPTSYRAFVCTTCHTQPATDPRHQGMPGYQWQSTSCLMCHPEGRAEGAGGLAQHDAIFPINSGTHTGKWTACADCHTDPNNRQVFSCMTGACHAQAATDPRHSGIPGYTYTAAQCRACHPDGRAGAFAQHDALFPINSGTHTGKWTACADCHTDPNTRATSSCLTGACHPATPTTPLHQGIPGYAYASPQCLSCHPTGLRGRFTQHDQLFFPIFSGKHAGRWSNDCAVCHTTPNNRLDFTCMTGSCHTASQTNGNHSGVRNYLYTATACYSCHADGTKPAPPFPMLRPPGAPRPSATPARQRPPLEAALRSYRIQVEDGRGAAGRRATSG